MIDQTLPARMAASLAAALATGGTRKSYGFLLKGHNEFAAAAGVTGAAPARIDNPESEANLAPSGTRCGRRAASRFGDVGQDARHGCR